MFENFKYGVPTPYYNNYSFSFSPDSKTKSLIIDVSGLNYNSDLYRFYIIITLGLIVYY